MGGLPSGFWESHFHSALHLRDSMISTLLFLFKSTNIIVFSHRQTISCVIEVNMYSLPFITLLINPACSAIFWYIWEIFCTLHVRFVVLFYLIFRLLRPDCSAISCASQVSLPTPCKKPQPFRSIFTKNNQCHDTPVSKENYHPSTLFTMDKI